MQRSTFIKRLAGVAGGGFIFSSCSSDLVEDLFQDFDSGELSIPDSRLWFENT